jgi:hypothetical protein
VRSNAIVMRLADDRLEFHQDEIGGFLVFCLPVLPMLPKTLASPSRVWRSFIRLCRCRGLLGHPDASDVRSLPFGRGIDSLVLRQRGSCEPSFSAAHTDSTPAVVPATQARCDPAADRTASHADALSGGTIHAAAQSQCSPWVSGPAWDWA